MIICCWFSCVDLEYFKFPDDKSSYFFQFLSVFFSRCSGHTHSCHHSLTLTHTHSRLFWQPHAGLETSLYTTCRFTATFDQTTPDTDNLFSIYPSFIIHLSPLFLHRLHLPIHPLPFLFPIHLKPPLDHAVSYFFLLKQLGCCGRLHHQ